MKNTLNYTNQIKNRIGSTGPLMWTEVDNNFQYANTWGIGKIYKQGMIVIWNDYTGIPNNPNGAMSIWICTNDHTSNISNPPGKLGSYWDRFYDSVLNANLATNAINDEDGNDIKTTYAKNAVFERVPISYKLTFNNVDDYVINSGAGDQNLGNNLGFEVVVLPGVTGHNHFLARDDEESFYYNINLVLEEAYGGIPIYIGVKATWVSVNGTNNQHYIDISDYFGPEDSNNNGIHFRNFEVAVPKWYIGPVNFVRFDVLCRRSSSGSTSITNGQLTFN